MIVSNMPNWITRHVEGGVRESLRDRSPRLGQAQQGCLGSLKSVGIHRVCTGLVRAPLSIHQRDVTVLAQIQSLERPDQIVGGDEADQIPVVVRNDVDDVMGVLNKDRVPVGVERFVYVLESVRDTICSLSSRNSVYDRDIGP